MHRNKNTARPHAEENERPKRVRRTRGDASPFMVLPAPGMIRDDAASDDARGNTVALAAPSEATGTVREVCAEVADDPKSLKPPRAPSEKTVTKTDTKLPPVKGGKKELPEYAGYFVDEVHRLADLAEVQKGLLNSQDDKVRQRSLERLLEMKYGKGGDAMEEQPPQIVIDVPRPRRVPCDEMEDR